MTIQPDYYAVLGVASDSEDVVIRAAYRALMMKYHPDTFAGDHQIADRKAKELNAAYEILSDPKKRAEYDAKQGRNSSPATDHTSKPATNRREDATSPRPKGTQNTTTGPNKNSKASNRPPPPSQSTTPEERDRAHKVGYFIEAAIFVWFCYAWIFLIGDQKQNTPPSTPPSTTTQSIPPASNGTNAQLTETSRSQHSSNSASGDIEPPVPNTIYEQEPSDVTPSSDPNLSNAVLLALDTGLIENWHS
jgi:curved DNA-binding protein CbpA